MSSNILVPEVGESIVDARVAKWLRKEGEAVAAGDPLVELETDKIDVEVSAPHAGVLSRIDRKDGEDVKVGEVLGILDESAPPEKGAATPAPVGGETTKDDASRTPRATPTARKAAEANEVDLSRVRGSGEGGRVMRRDVEQAAGAAAPPPAASHTKAKPVPPVAEERRHRKGIAPKSACACPSAARRLLGGWSRRRARPRCSPRSMKST